VSPRIFRPPGVTCLEGANLKRIFVVGCERSDVRPTVLEL
jgi:hypothetical protein